MATRTVATTDTLNTFRTNFNTLSGTDIGDPASLATSAKTIVAAINEINTSVSATGFTMSDGSTTQSVVAGNTVTFTGSSGIYKFPCSSIRIVGTKISPPKSGS